MSDVIKTMDEMTNAKSEIMEENNIHMPPNAKEDKKNSERHFCISLAGHTIGIDTLYKDTYVLCKDYLCDDKPEININIDENDLEYEKKQTNQKNTFYRDGYLETLAVYRKICKSLLAYDTFLMHGAVVAKGQNAYLFTAQSGTGKTTHIRLWLDNLKDAYIVNGDKPLIRITETDAIACGTPWCGKEKMGQNRMVPLRAIVLMERAEDNSIKEISFSEALSTLLQQSYQPIETELMKITIQLISCLKQRIKFYKFHFNNMKENAFAISYNELTGANICKK